MNRTRCLKMIVVAVATLALSACGWSYQGLDLPGSGQSGRTYRLSADFADVLNLASGAPVVMGGLSVGRVHDVRTDGMSAVADMDIGHEVRIPVGTAARLRYDTPLGQMFIELEATGGSGYYSANATIPKALTDTAPTVEDTLAEASLLINGGGLGQLQTINHELNNALDGRQTTVRGLLTQTDTFLKGANAGAHDMTQALSALNQAAAALKSRRQVFGDAIAAIQPAAKLLTTDTPLLTKLLDRTSSLTGQANRLFAATQTSLVDLVVQLGPILDQVIASTPYYLHGSTSLAQVATLLPILVPGDFAPLNIVMSLDLQRLLGSSGSGGSGGGRSSGGGSGSSGGPAGGLGGLLGGLTGLVGKR